MESVVAKGLKYPEFDDDVHFFLFGLKLTNLAKFVS